MAKKAAPKKAASPVIPAAKPVLAPQVADAVVQQIEQPIAETPVRKSVLPKATPVTKKAPVPVTYEKIAERAYYISRSGHGGSEHDNWLRAEAELKSEA